MSMDDLLWLPPVMLAIALVLGTSGTESAREATRHVVRTFVSFTAGVLCVGALIHLIARLFA